MPGPAAMGGPCASTPRMKAWDGRCTSSPSATFSTIRRDPEVPVGRAGAEHVLLRATGRYAEGPPVSTRRGVPGGRRQARPAREEPVNLNHPNLTVTDWHRLAQIIQTVPNREASGSV